MALATSQRWLLAWKMLTIWIASGKHSSARDQIQGAPSAEDDPAVGIGETAAFGFAAHALGEGGGFAVGIATGGRLDGGRVGD